MHRPILLDRVSSRPIKIIDATQPAKSIPKLTTAGTSFPRLSPLLGAGISGTCGYSSSLLFILNLPAQVYPAHNALCRLTYRFFIIAGLCIAIDLIIVGQQHHFVIIQKGKPSRWHMDNKNYNICCYDSESLWLVHGHPYSWVRWPSRPCSGIRADQVPVLSYLYLFSYDSRPN